MNQTRKVVMMDSNGKIWTGEQEIPELRDGQLLVEVHASMVSPGSGLGGVKSRRANPSPNPTHRPFGYTNAGVVIDKKGDCDEFEVGDRVAGMGGGYALHASHACIPHNLCAKIPDNVSPEEAASNHLAATALHAVQRGRIVLGEHVCCGWTRLGWATFLSNRPNRRGVCHGAGQLPQTGGDCSHSRG